MATSTRRAGRSEEGPEAQLKRALKVHDVAEVGRIVETLRMGGMRYAEIWALAQPLTGDAMPMTLAEWDALMQEVDDA